MTTAPLKILTLNAHKGFSQFNTKSILAKLREAIRSTSADLVFLQEILGENHTDNEHHELKPNQSQYEFLADSIWKEYAYGKNATYDEGHHGNAILSKFPIKKSNQITLPTSKLEQRGFLHCELSHPENRLRIHCICLHLGLLNYHRKKQFDFLIQYVEKNIPAKAPLILAGDLNDWNEKAIECLQGPLHLTETFLATHGEHARSFPGKLPLLKLDRIYVRNFKVKSAKILDKNPWKSLSDHSALLAEIELHPESTEA